MSIVVNFFSGPSGGKSTLAAGIFYELKKRGINCDYITEYPKDLVWEGNHRALGNQLYVFSNQAYWQEQRRDKCDVIITDSPLLLSLIYNADKTTANFKALVQEVFGSWDNLNYFIERSGDFQEAGRVHGEVESQKLDKAIFKMLCDTNQNFMAVDQGTDFWMIIGEIMARLENNDR